VGRKDHSGLRLAARGATLPSPHATSGDFLTDTVALLPRDGGQGLARSSAMLRVARAFGRGDAGPMVA
jgi:hypothetical protein